MKIRFNLPNGWTLSICEDLEPAICNVAAWPTSQGEPKVGGAWFDFGGRGGDVRCFDLDDMLAAIDAVRKAPQS
jgi:hypothetical protein